MRIAFTHNVQTRHGEEEAEFDTPETVAAITRALESLGHQVFPVPLNGPIHHWLPRLEAARPALVFNTAEGHRGRFREASCPSLFELMGIPFTGSDAFVCGVTLDKRLTKMIAERGGVLTPRWAFALRVEDIPADFPLPAIAKPNFEGSSKGITGKSIADTPAGLREAVGDLLARFPEGVLVEEFIEGKDVVVPWLELASPETGGVLSPAGYRFQHRASGGRTIYDFSLKNVDSSSVEVVVPADVSRETTLEMATATRRVVHDLGIRDISRLDFRVDKEGRAYFLEINALPSLEPGATIFESAKLVGLPTFASVLGKVVESAARRWKIPPEKASTRRRIGFIYNLKRVKPGQDGQDDHEAEYDSQGTVDAIKGALESLGHDVVPMEATPEVTLRIASAGIDLAFNMSEGTHGRNRESLVPLLLETLGIPYTGSDAATMSICLDKSLAKRVVRDAGVRTAPFMLMARGDEPLVAGLSFPLVVKPVAEGSSKGVHLSSVVHDEAQLRGTVRAMLDRYAQPALVEGYLPGREFTVPVLGWPELTVLPPMEIVFTEKADPFPVYSFRHKQDFNPQVRYETRPNLTPTQAAEIDLVVRTSFTALGCRDVARVDLRMDAAGHVNFIECNPLPGLTPEWSDLCLITRAAGIEYKDLIHRIVAPTLARLDARDAAQRNGAT